MTGVRIGYAKREIRLLGLAVTRNGGSFVIVGAVTRGASRLEGVLKAEAASPDLTTEAAAMITASPHLGQVRAVLFDEEALPGGVVIDAEALWRAVGKPVVVLRPRGSSPSGFWGGSGFLCFGVSAPGASRVLRASAQGAGPEAVQLAGAVAGSLQGAGEGLKEVTNPRR